MDWNVGFISVCSLVLNYGITIRCLNWSYLYLWFYKFLHFILPHVPVSEYVTKYEICGMCCPKNSFLVHILNIIEVILLQMHIGLHVK